MKKLKISGSIIFVLILFIVISPIIQRATFERTITKTAEDFPEIVATVLKNKYNYISVDCSIVSEILNPSESPKWFEKIEVSIVNDDSFDKQSKKEQYDEIKTILEDLNQITQSYFPKYYQYSFTDNRPQYDKKHVEKEEDTKIIISTSQNRYQLDDLSYFTKNGTPVILKDSTSNSQNSSSNYSNYHSTPSSSYSSARHSDTEAWACAKDIVLQNLKSPSSAKFCSFTEAQITDLGSGEYMVVGWVEAQNSYGAMLRNTFVVTYTATSNGYKNGSAIIG